MTRALVFLAIWFFFGGIFVGAGVGLKRERCGVPLSYPGDWSFAWEAAIGPLMIPAVLGAAFGADATTDADKLWEGTCP